MGYWRGHDGQEQPWLEGMKDGGRKKKCGEEKSKKGAHEEVVKFNTAI
jgi:hypothetical protein